MEKNLRLIGTILSTLCDKIYYYPGMKGSVIATKASKNSAPSMNERNAFELAYGACLAGQRSTVVFKGIGLATCLDSVQHAVIHGVNGGLVVILLEDTVAVSSPEIIDSRLLFDYTQTLVVEPKSIEDTIQHLKSAHQLSEQLDVPVMFRFTYELLSSMLPARSDATTIQPKRSKKKVKANLRQKVIGAWPERKDAFEQKLDKIQSYIDNIYEKCDLDKDIECIAFGYTNKNDSTPKRTIHVEHYPVASPLRTLYQKKQDILISEIGSNYGQKGLQSNRASVDNSKAGQGNLAPSSRWNLALNNIDKSAYSIVVSDEGMHTFDSTNKTDFCLCMGSAINIGAGASESTAGKALVIVGDFGYQFTGAIGIAEAYYRNIDLDVILLDDGVASSTGGQKSIGPVNSRDFEHYTNSYRRLSFDSLGDKEFIAADTKGINIYHIIR